MHNVGNIDRLIRTLIGLLLLSLVFIGPKTAWGWIGLVPIATAIISYCPVYTVFGANHSDEDS